MAIKRKTIIIEEVAFTFCWCPAGKFMMGSPQSEIDHWDREILHQVAIPNGFWILATPVTQQQFMLTKKRNPATFCSTGRYRNRVVDLDTSNFPIENVSWFAAEMYCRRMSQKLYKMKIPFYFDLPTEAEWEYACRAGTTTPFAFGEELGNNANYITFSKWGLVQPPANLAKPRPTPVGTYPPNAWGIYDMHGNISEWVADWYIGYDNKEYKSIDGYKLKVFRGGNWEHPQRFARSAWRNKTYPEIKSEHIGFRVTLRKTATENKECESTNL